MNLKLAHAVKEAAAQKLTAYATAQALNGASVDNYVAIAAFKKVS